MVPNALLFCGNMYCHGKSVNALQLFYHVMLLFRNWLANVLCHLTTVRVTACLTRASGLSQVLSSKYHTGKLFFQLL